MRWGGWFLILSLAASPSVAQPGDQPPGDTAQGAHGATETAWPAPPPVPSQEEFFQVIRTEGIAKALDLYRNVRKFHPGDVLFNENALNDLGHEYLGQGLLDEAVAIFALNVEAYPDRWNTYDSYAHALMMRGEIAAALANFRHAVALNPNNAFGARYVTIFEKYTKQEHMIPMRDGVRLYTQVYIPKDTSKTYPFLLQQTPYSVEHYGPTDYANRLGPDDVYLDERFIFVYQDVRGTFKSEGDFAIMRPLAREKTSPQDTDESTDVYDTIEWLLRNVPNHNGRVGQWGGSYSAWQAVMGMIAPHPALKASVLCASPSDMWIGDDFHHNGAFRLMYTFSFVDRSGRPRTGPTTTIGPWFDYGTRDGYKFFLDLGPLRNVNDRCFHHAIPTWNEYMEHGDYDEYWRERNVLPHLANVTHAVLNVAGWFDAEDFYGPMSIYKTMEDNTPNNRSTLVVGPWRHGGWSRGAGDRLFDLEFGSDTAEFFREKVEFPFLMSHLKGDATYTPPEALVFETGANEWRSLDQWPPKFTTESRLYFHADGTLSFMPPVTDSASACNCYTSDPAKPVPWSTNIQTQQGHQWMVEDQRFAGRRPDVLVYESDVLAESVTIAGPITAHLHVATTGTDADYVVKLIDVFPSDARSKMSDYQMLLSAEVMRAKYRNSFVRPEPMVPGRITEIAFALPERYHRFLEGHRIMVQVQSTWFPVIDLNPQTFVDIYRATEDDFRKATHTVHCSAQHPSYIEVQLME
jgi:putative CocE/NonD family hydrolase